MIPVRQSIGGLGNLMFKQAFLYAIWKEGIIPDIYLQSVRYWDTCQDDIREMFGQGIGEKIDKVSLHIRRGDYVNNNFYVDLWQTDYYKKAIAMFPEDTKFIVFCRDNQSWETDKADREWCRKNLKPLLGDRFELPPKENTEIDDLNLMANCKAHIMANSSFSWWASYLGGGRTIAPKAWFTDGVQRTELMPEWEVI
jgi:hypothetical protein